MIPSIDTYLYNEIESKLQIIVSNRYIIEEILKGVQKNVADNFMRAYTGANARDIPIIYTMPQDKQTQQGAIYIGLREGDESNPSIGNVEDTYSFKKTGLYKDASMIYASPDNTRCYLEVTNPIGELISVEGISFAKVDNVTIEGKRVYFNYDASLVGQGAFNVNYEDTVGTEMGTSQGFTSTEHYSVLAVSTNMDTVRCLDLIIKAILVLMRSNPEELNENLLQHVQFGQIQEIHVGQDASGNPMLLYGRETIVTYKVSYSLDVPILQTINKIIINANQA